VRACISLPFEESSPSESHDPNSHQPASAKETNVQIRANDIVVTIDGRQVLSANSVHVREGQTLALVGPSGSGKTTLLSVLGLLVRPDKGHVIIGEEDSSRWKDARRRRFWQKHAAFVFQDHGLIDEKSVAYNVMLARLPLFGAHKRDVANVQAILERVGLSGRGKETVSTLSGGEKQRVGLARAMFREADVIFADEPTASLDRANRELVTGFLQAEARRGSAVVIATHDEQLIAACDVRLDLAKPTRQ
jgi:putative ABC transport system ATP-binding protein